MNNLRRPRSSVPGVGRESLLEVVPSVAKPGNGGGPHGTPNERKLARGDDGTCRWQGASGRGGSAVGVAGFGSVLGRGARTGMPVPAQRLK